MEIANDQQRKAFSLRLARELSRFGLNVSSPTQIAREFNQHFAGNPVTAQTVRKWLQGETMPTQAKLVALSEWLGLSAQWLRFGTGPKETTTDNHGPVASPECNGNEAVQSIPPQLTPVIESICLLSQENFRLVEGIVRLMLDGQMRS